MEITREKVESDVSVLLRSLADDWEYSGEIAPDTYLIRDMGFESLGVVILSTTVQNHYGVTLPYTDFFAEIGQREVRDITVDEWVDFTYTHLQQA